MTEYKVTMDDIMFGVPDKDTLLLIDALLFAVYGWNPNKIKRMSLSSARRWTELAKKRMTWGDSYKLRMLLEPKSKSVFQKVISKIKL